MSEPSSRICQNCCSENESSFQYCSNCGQKNTDGKITFSELWSEFQDAVFNIESRTWRTLKNIFVPGKLTLEYFSGKQRQYVHPLRLLLVTSIPIILAMNFQDFHSMTNHQFNIKEEILKNYERQHLYGILGKITTNTNAIFPDGQTAIITDTILTSFEDSLWTLLSEYGDRYGDSINLHDYVGPGSWQPEMLSKTDFLNMNEDELVSKYKNEAGIIDRLIFKQKAKYIKDESQLFAAVVGHTTWAIFLMMPCLAFILYLLYVRHKYFYVEHLIFTFHFQSFLFILLAILVVGMRIFPWWIMLTFLLAIMTFLFMSILKVYRQSMGKTLLKFCLFSISYVGIFIVILFGTLFASFLLI